LAAEGQPQLVHRIDALQELARWVEPVVIPSKRIGSVDAVGGVAAEGHIAAYADAFLLLLQRLHAALERGEVLLQRVHIHTEVRQLLLEGLSQSLQGLHSGLELSQLVHRLLQLLHLSAQLLDIRGGLRCLTGTRDSDLPCNLLDAVAQRSNPLVDVAVSASD
jgi:hypothetical protein